MAIQYAVWMSDVRAHAFTARVGRQNTPALLTFTRSPEVGIIVFISQIEKLRLCVSGRAPEPAFDPRHTWLQSACSTLDPLWLCFPRPGEDVG